MTCDEIRERLLVNELEGMDSTADTEAHVSACPECARERDELQTSVPRLEHDLRSLFRIRRIMQRLDTRTSRKVMARRLMKAAASIVLITGAFLLYQLTRETRIGVFLLSPTAAAERISDHAMLLHKGTLTAESTEPVRVETADGTFVSDAGESRFVVSIERAEYPSESITLSRVSVVTGFLRATTVAGSIRIGPGESATMAQDEPPLKLDVETRAQIIGWATHLEHGDRDVRTQAVKELRRLVAVHDDAGTLVRYAVASSKPETQAVARRLLLQAAANKFGKITFMRYGEIWKSKCDGSEAALIHDPSRPIDRVAQSRDGGTLGYLDRKTLLISTAGKPSFREVAFKSTPVYLAISPDGKKIAVVGESETSIVNADTLQVEELEAHVVAQPVWSSDGSGLIPWTQSVSDLLADVCLSPHGRKLAFIPMSGLREIHVMDPDGSNITRITHMGLDCRKIRWSPDGKHLAFSTQPSTSPTCLYQCAADGNNLLKLVELGQMQVSDLAWSADGKAMLYTAKPYTGGTFSIYWLALDAPELVPELIVQNAALVDWAVTLPDKRR